MPFAERLFLSLSLCVLLCAPFFSFNDESNRNENRFSPSCAAANNNKLIIPSDCIFYSSSRRRDVPAMAAVLKHTIQCRTTSALFE